MDQALTREILNRLSYLYLQTDGSMRFPNSAEGDLLKMTYRLLAPIAPPAPPPSPLCSCGHDRAAHKDGTGNCAECDRQGAFGGNDHCSSFHPTPPQPPPFRFRTLEQRVAALEEQVQELMEERK